MPGPSRIESYAIVSVDGMLADGQRVIPDELKVDAGYETALGAAASRILPGGLPVLLEHHVCLSRGAAAGELLRRQVRRE